MNYGSIFSQKITPQVEQIPLSNQIPNNGGGWGFEVDKWTQLQRFLLLGTESGTFYVNERKLTIENAKKVIECIYENGPKTVITINSVSSYGKAHKNEPAIFALVLCMKFGNQETKRIAYKMIPYICRTGTHLFILCQYIKDIRGWSGGLRKGIASFYTEKTLESLMTQVTKYRQRNGWTHKDVIRLCHAKPKNENQNNLFKWILGKEEKYAKNLYIEGFELLQKEDTSFIDIVRQINFWKFTWEMLPTHLLNKPEIWIVLLPHLGMTALIRNLAKMTSIGVLKSNIEDTVQYVIKKLTDEEEIKNSKIHPMTILLAMKTYSSGHGFRGSLSWKPVQSIVDALDTAFYKSFSNIEPSGKKFLIGLDVSGSMCSTINNTNISSREASSALCMILKKTEPKTDIMAFSSRFTPISFGEKTRLDDVINITKKMEFGQTDCSLPMLYALENKLEVDVFIIFTDNETNYGLIHPCQTLKFYRDKMNKPQAKLIVCAMEAYEISIADPTDGNMLDCIGLDANLPVVINQFASNRI